MDVRIVARVKERVELMEGGSGTCFSTEFNWCELGILDLVVHRMVLLQGVRWGYDLNRMWAYVVCCRWVGWSRGRQVRSCLHGFLVGETRWDLRWTFR